MEGSEVGTMDGETQIRWTVGSSQNTQCRRLHRVAVRSDKQTETLRDRVIAATVEVAAPASNPRLAKTRDARAAA
jgi:uncharacterized heparinase superfamily protein